MCVCVSLSVLLREPQHYCEHQHSMRLWIAVALVACGNRNMKHAALPWAVDMAGHIAVALAGHMTSAVCILAGRSDSRKFCSAGNQTRLRQLLQVMACVHAGLRSEPSPALTSIRMAFIEADFGSSLTPCCQVQ